MAVRARFGTAGRRRPDHGSDLSRRHWSLADVKASGLNLALEDLRGRETAEFAKGMADLLASEVASVQEPPNFGTLYASLL